jgi:hypothetical protein
MSVSDYNILISSNSKVASIGESMHLPVTFFCMDQTVITLVEKIYLSVGSQELHQKERKD